MHVLHHHRRQISIDQGARNGPTARVLRPRRAAVLARVRPAALEKRTRPAPVPISGADVGCRALGRLDLACVIENPHWTSRPPAPPPTAPNTKAGCLGLPPLAGPPAPASSEHARNSSSADRASPNRLRYPLCAGLSGCDSEKPVASEPQCCWFAWCGCKWDAASCRGVTSL